MPRFPFQIAALPEANIPVRSAPGFLNAWKRRQMQSCLSQPESGVHRVALCSQIPFSPCVLNVDAAAARYAAGTFVVQGPSGQGETLLVVAVYLQAGDEAAAQQQASEIIAAAVSTGLRYVLIGDYNLEQHQAALGFTSNRVARMHAIAATALGPFPTQDRGVSAELILRCLTGDFRLSQCTTASAISRTTWPLNTISCLVLLWPSLARVEGSSQTAPPSKLMSSFKHVRPRILHRQLNMPIWTRPGLYSRT